MIKVRYKQISMQSKQIKSQFEIRRRKKFEILNGNASQMSRDKQREGIQTKRTGFRDWQSVSVISARSVADRLRVIIFRATASSCIRRVVQEIQQIQTTKRQKRA